MKRPTPGIFLSAVKDAAKLMPSIASNTARHGGSSPHTVRLCSARVVVPPNADTGDGAGNTMTVPRNVTFLLHPVDNGSSSRNKGRKLEAKPDQWSGFSLHPCTVHPQVKLHSWKRLKLLIFCSKSDHNKYMVEEAPRGSRTNGGGHTLQLMNRLMFENNIGLLVEKRIHPTKCGYSSLKENPQGQSQETFLLVPQSSSLGLLVSLTNDMLRFLLSRDPPSTTGGCTNVRRTAILSSGTPRGAAPQHSVVTPATLSAAKTSEKVASVNGSHNSIPTQHGELLQVKKRVTFGETATQESRPIMNKRRRSVLLLGGEEEAHELDSDNKFATIAEKDESEIFGIAFKAKDQPLDEAAAIPEEIHSHGASRCSNKEKDTSVPAFAAKVDSQRAMQSTLRHEVQRTEENTSDRPAPTGEEKGDKTTDTDIQTAQALSDELLNLQSPQKKYESCINHNKPSPVQLALSITGYSNDQPISLLPDIIKPFVLTMSQILQLLQSKKMPTLNHGPSENKFHDESSVPAVDEKIVRCLCIQALLRIFISVFLLESESENKLEGEWGWLLPVSDKNQSKNDKKKQAKKKVFKYFKVCSCLSYTRLNLQLRYFSYHKIPFTHFCVL
jgi:hypothetical protein